MRERWIAARAPRAPAYGPDGLPFPPTRLRVLVDGHGDPDRFRRDGELGAQAITSTLQRAGLDLRRFDSVLDFGCGCGRVARYWVALAGPELHGCDYNPDLVDWCRSRLGFMEARVNAPDPPAPYEDGRFDFIYAISIVTHLTEAAAAAWIADFHRMLRPSGCLLITTHGDYFTHRLTPAEQHRYRAGQVVVQRSGAAGTNACAAFHPPAYVTDELLEGFDCVSFDAGPSPSGFPQDVYLARVGR